MVNKKAIVEAIRRAEQSTRGEIRVHVKAVCREDVFWEAKKVFERLGMHRTKERNAVLIFVALKTRRFAIVGDEGIHRRVGDSTWAAARDLMAAHFAKGEIQEGIVAGVSSVGEKLRQYFPAGRENWNELPNQITEGK